MSSRFDDIVEQNENQVDINIQKNIYSIVYLLHKLTKTGLLKLKHDIKVKPLAIFRISFSFRIQ